MRCLCTLAWLTREPRCDVDGSTVRGERYVSGGARPENGERDALAGFAGAAWWTAPTTMWSGLTDAGGARLTAATEDVMTSITSSKSPPSYQPPGKLGSIGDANASGARGAILSISRQATNRHSAIAWILSEIVDEISIDMGVSYQEACLAVRDRVIRGNVG